MTDSEKMKPGGLIHALTLDGAGGVAEAFLTPVERLDTGTWLHFQADDEDAQQWLSEVSGLNDVAAGALTAEDTRPRVLRRGDNLLLTLRGASSRLTEGGGQDLVSLRIWTNGHSLISARMQGLAATDCLLSELAAGEGPKSTVELITHWVDLIVDDMSDEVQAIEGEMSRIEEEVLSETGVSSRSDVLMLRKKLIMLRRYIAPQREALARLTTETPTWLDEMSRVRLRDITDRLVRYVEVIDQVSSRASLVQDEIAAQISDSMNRRTYIFTVVAAIFLPLGFITGLLGVNVGGVPGVDDPSAFLQLVIACTLIGMGLIAAFRWRRWM